jgi:hypothetical protein
VHVVVQRACLTCCEYCSTATAHVEDAVDGLSPWQLHIGVAVAGTPSHDDRDRRWLGPLVRQVHVLVDAAEEAVEARVSLQAQGQQATVEREAGRDACMDPSEQLRPMLVTLLYQQNIGLVLDELDAVRPAALWEQNEVSDDEATILQQ